MVPARTRRALLALAATVLAVPASPLLSAAHAGTYDVYSCKTPSGHPTSTAGWTGTSNLLTDRPSNDCALGGRLSAVLTANGGVSGGLFSRWQFTAPRGTSIVSATLQRSVVARAQAGDTKAAAQAAVYRGAFRDDAAHRATFCSSGGDGCPATTGAQQLQVDGNMFGFSAGCAGAMNTSLCYGAATGHRARIAVGSAKITLGDASSPSARASGQAIRTGPLRGRTSVAIKARDTGSGVWQAEVRLGAKVVVARRTLDANRGRCRLLPGTRAFGWPVPCAHTVAATLPINTHRAKDGSQLLTVTVWDAANNPKVVVSKPVLVDNDHRVQANGTILMPRITDPLGDPLTTAATAAGLQPIGAPSDPHLSALVTAMNTLAEAKVPYCYGGGHQSTPAVIGPGTYCWQGNPAQRVTNSGAVGFDCSSSVSWALQQAGWAIPTMTSSEFAQLGDAGPGQQMTIWANAGHVYMEVIVGGQSYYWGTSSLNPEHGPGWHPPRSGAGFTPRHLPGL